MVQVDYKRTILKTILFTLLILIVLLAIVILLMFFVFTKNLADIMYNMGCDNIASTLYYRVYEKSDDIYSCYKALNIKISIGDNEKVIKYYDTFVTDDEYEEFMSASRLNSERLNISVLEKSAILNDENYLVNNYIKALIKEEKVDKAWQKALTEFVDYMDIDLKNQGVYALSSFVERREWTRFNTVQENFDEILVQEMQNYFDNIYDIFMENKDSEQPLDKAYLIALGNRFINVGQDINVICNELNINSELVSRNIDRMIAVNDEIKGLV